MEQKELVKAGVHLGHLTRRWNPAMAPYIFMAKGGVHIIDVNETKKQLTSATETLKTIARQGKKVLFVGTKAQAKTLVASGAKKVRMPYVSERWLGGMLTNFSTIRRSLRKLQAMEKLMKDESYQNMAKKERLRMSHQKAKKEHLLEGIAHLNRLPAALFVVDINREHIAVDEARKLNIPIFAIVDTNTDPRHIDHPIPGNDDSYTAIQAILGCVVEAIQQGQQERDEAAGDTPTSEPDETQASGETVGDAKELREEAKGEEGTVRTVQATQEAPKGKVDSASVPSKRIAAKREDQPEAKREEMNQDKQTAVSAQQVQALRKKTGAGMMDCKRALAEAQGDSEKAVEILRKKGEKISALRADRQTTEGTVFAQISKDQTEGVMLSLTCETDFVGKNQDFRQLGEKILQVAFKKRPKNIEELKQLPVEKEHTVQTEIASLVGKIGEKIDIGAYEWLSAPKGQVLSYIHAGNKLGVLLALSKQGDETITTAGMDVAMQVAAMRPIAVSEQEVPEEVTQKELEIGRELAKKEGKPDPIIDKIAQGRLQKFFKEHTLLKQDFIKNPKLSVQQHLHAVDKDLTALSFKRISVDQ